MPKKSWSKSTLPSGVRGRFAKSSVETRNIWPAPSASRRRDDRRVDPEEAVLVEEAVDRLRERVAHAGDRAEDVRARPQVRDLAQVLQRVALRLHRVGVGIVDPADDLDRCRARTSTAWPLPCDATSSPVARTAQPVVMLQDLGSGSSAARRARRPGAASKQLPSWIARNDRPALESRRVRIQPSIVTLLPTGDLSREDERDACARMAH